MKKKVFSKLLMGALLVASVSSFTSCKDYDDDINDLRSRIDGLNTSLNTTVTNKIATVESSIDLLSKQLAEVKADYAKADEALKTALQTSINAAADKASAAADKATANASDILKLQGEVVNLKTTDANLQAAIDKLEGALEKANATLKTQGETLIGLAATDQALETGINEAKAQAANALSEAKKAQDAAATNAANLKSTDATLAALQNTVAENLKTVNNKIDSEIAKLDTRIKTNETNIAKLQESSAKAEANIVTINSKLSELAAKDTEISNTVSEGLTKLAASLGTSVEELKTLINNNKSELISKIGEEATARVEAINALSNRVTANEVAISNIQSETIPQLIKNLREHLVPEYVEKEVAKQLPAALEVFMTDEVMPYVEEIVATETGKNKSLIDALTAKVKKDSTDLVAFTDAQLILTAALLAGEVELDDEASVDALCAKELADAISAADDVLQNNIQDVADALADEKNADKAGSLAALIAQIKNEADETSLAAKLKALTSGFNAVTNEADPTSLAGRFKTIEDFFAPAADDAEAADISVANLAAKIAETESFTEAVNKAAADANGEILGMITAINLFANQHMADADSYGKYIYTNGDDYRYAVGYEEFDHELNFVYTIERGIWDAQATELKEKTWNFPDKYIRDDIDNTKWYSTRGKDEAAKLNENYFDFVEGRYRSYEDSILVRVSPVNADLRKAKLALLNSKGDDIIDAGLIELVDVQKYTREGYITRAAAGNETGLWVIKFKLNDAEVGEKWLNYAFYNGRPIVYAVAVKTTGISEDEDGNITSDGVERYVASEYDLSLNTEEASHAYNFKVNETIISKIHNRYIETEEGMAGSSAYWTDDPERNTFRYELYWTSPCEPENVEPDQPSTPSQEEEIEKPWYYMTGCECMFDPDGNEIDDCPDQDDEDWGVGYHGYTYVYFDKNRDGYETPKEDCYPDINAKDRPYHKFNDAGQRRGSGIDNRHLKDFLQIDFDYEMDGAMWAKIDIEFPSIVCNTATPIRGFFVTLDQQFALESGNSEINAWVSYQYKNVGYYSTNKGVKDGRYDVPATLFKGNKGTIYIKDANNIVNGDVVGFRVHAVNLDGTLYDPDGRAFYVKFGKQETRHQLSFDITVNSDKDSAVAVQNPVEGVNPIKAFNDKQKAAGSDVRFFQRDQYPGSFIPEETYKIEYTWREDNPAVRDANYSRALIPVAGTNYGVNAGTTSGNPHEIPVLDFFDFYFSENADADVEDKTGDVENEWTYFNKTYDENQKVAANRLTQSVRAQINKGVANRLIDGATYKITATISRKDAQTDWRVVNIIDIDITKNMPTDVPEKFHVKSHQLEGGTWTFFLRPLLTTSGQIGNGTPWRITWGDYAANWLKKSTFAAGFNGDLNMNDEGDPTDLDNGMFHMYRWGMDVRPYNFDEIFYGLYEYGEQVNEQPGTEQTTNYDKNFYFVFKGAGDFNKSNTTSAWSAEDAEIDTYADADAFYKDADAITVYKENTTAINPGTSDQELLKKRGNYTLPAIHWSHLGQKKNVLVGYIYRNISGKLNENGTQFLNTTSTSTGHYDAAFQGLDIKYSDYVIDPVQVKNNAGEDVVAEFKCAFDEAIRNVDCNGIYNEKVIANEFEYNSDLAVAADSAQFNAFSSQWIAGNENQKFFDAWLPYGSDLKLAKGKGPAATDPIKDQDPWVAANVLRALVQNDAVSKKLGQLVSNGYLWIDKESLQVIATSPADFKFSDYYYPPFWKSTSTTSQAIKIGMNRKGTSEGLLTLNKDVTGKFVFKVMNVWGHTRDITVTFKIKKPSTATGARATR